MTGIGPDIVEVLNELGTLVNIIKHDGSATVQEYIDYEIKVEANSPFLTQFMIDCTLRYDTSANPGDIIQFADDSTNHILAVHQKSRFEQNVVVVEGLLYRCNMTGTVYRRSETRGADYSLGVTWTATESNEPVLLTGLIDYYDMKDKDYGIYSVSQDNLHVSGDCDIQVGDRFTSSDGDSYEIKGIAKYRLNNVWICRVVPDTRE